MIRRYALVLFAAGVLALGIAIHIPGNAGAQDADCAALAAQSQSTKDALDAARHAEKEAFKAWDKYYQQLHSGTYAGTEEPLADTVEACQSGGGNYCDRAMDDYNKIAPKEAETKQALDAAKANTAKAEAGLNTAINNAVNNNCQAE